MRKELKTLIGKIKTYYKKSENKGFCTCDSDITIEDDGLRCILCGKLVGIKIGG